MTKNRMGVVITGLKMGVSVSIVTPFPLRDCCKITSAAHGINSSLPSPHFSHTQLHIRTHGMHTHAKHKNVYRGIQRNFRNCSHLSFHIPKVPPPPSPQTLDLSCSGIAPQHLLFPSLLICIYSLIPIFPLPWYHAHHPLSVAKYWVQA